jgi:hypothetical protein
MGDPAKLALVFMASPFQSNESKLKFTPALERTSLTTWENKRLVGAILNPASSARQARPGDRTNPALKT